MPKAYVNAILPIHVCPDPTNVHPYHARRAGCHHGAEGKSLMKTPRVSQYFTISCAPESDQMPESWVTEDTASTLAEARKKRDRLAATHARKDPNNEDPWVWKLHRVVQLVEEVQA